MLLVHGLIYGPALTRNTVVVFIGLYILLIYSTKVSTCTAESDIQLHFEWLQVQRSTCHTLRSLYLQYKYIVSGSSTTCTAKLLFHKLNIGS